MINDCVMLVLICVKKPETKEVTSRGKITDDLVVQNKLIDAAIAHTVLYFTACNQDSQSERSSTRLKAVEIAPGQSVLSGAGKRSKHGDRLA